MDYNEIARKWQQKWKQAHLHDFVPKKDKKKYYVLEMFSYPSGYNLHVGHWFNYGLSDSFARFKRMQGYNVFQPMGFDSFGLPAENFAIKTGIHPQDSITKVIATMETQFDAIGGMFDWSKKVVTSTPEYYKWTQWLFLQLFDKGLAYQKNAPVNFCTECNTVIANEQVTEGCCERCGGAVIKKDMTQWFLKITDYSEQLLEDLENLDWPEKTKRMQKNWIGKSEGAEICFTTGEHSFSVFTTRADTLFGVSYVVLAPEHPLVDKIVSKDCVQSVQEYKAQVARMSDIDRQTTKEKSGVFTGAYATHPLNGQSVPIWIGDYVLYGYGTGAVMGVPAHDERDFEFAKKYNLPIKRVVAKQGSELPYCEDGVLVDSQEFDGLTSQEARGQIAQKLEQKNLGQKRTTYRLRDWSVSRQRYWGCPIPIVHCSDCGAVPEKLENLPITLPYDINFTPDGQSPLRRSSEYINTVCPKCGKKAVRDADTLDTFVCSSWYFLRYPEADNMDVPFSDKVNEMLPVDKYIGGAEHACMHLLYARFVTKALRDMGYLNFGEPFTSLVHQGVILGADGNKMSKSAGNVVNADQNIETYGSDVYRLFLMFSLNYVDGGILIEESLKSVSKFVDRFCRIIEKICAMPKKHTSMGANESELEYALHYAIKNISENMEVFSFNTAVARLMELVNAMYKYDALAQKNTGFLHDVAMQTVLLCAPMMPHICEELYHNLGGQGFVVENSYPKCDERKLVKDEVEIVVQINSKIRARVFVASSLNEQQIEEVVLKSPEVVQALNGVQVKKAIVIKGRLVNLIV